MDRVAYSPLSLVSVPGSPLQIDLLPRDIVRDESLEIDPRHLPQLDLDCISVSVSFAVECDESSGSLIERNRTFEVSVNMAC
jgi:hypothetical protein